MKKKMKKKALSLVLAMALTVSLIGCGSSTTTETPAETTETETEETTEVESEETTAEEKSNTLLVRVPSDPGTIGPHNMKSPMYAQDWTYEGLVDLKNNEIVPCLAKSWEVSEDGLTYTFTLRDDVKFSDGSDFDSAIAKKNIEAVKNHADGFSFIQCLDVIETVDAPDAYTLIFQLSQPCNSMLSDLAFTRPMVMLGEAGFPVEGDPYDNNIQAIVGTGEWVIDEYVQDQYTIYKRNEYYWGEMPKFEYLKAIVIPDINTATTAMKAGEVDVIISDGEIPADMYNQMLAEGFSGKLEPTTCITNLNINTAGKYTNDVEVRLALEYATNKLDITEGFYGGLQEVADTYFSSKVPYADVVVEPYAYDIEKANQLLDEAGWILEDGDVYRTKDGETLSLDLIYDSSVTNDRDMGLILQSQYAQVGIQLNIVPQDSGVYRENWASGAFDLLIYTSWGGLYEPFATLAAMSKDGDKFNTVQKGMDNKVELDKVMVECLSEADPIKLQENFEYIVTSLHEQAVYVPLAINNIVAVYNSELSEPYIHTNSSIDISDMYWID